MSKKAVPTGGKWIRQIFQAKAAKRHGIVRRKVTSVIKYASHDELEAAVKSRGYHLLISGNQYLIFCHAGEFKVIC